MMMMVVLRTEDDDGDGSDAVLLTMPAIFFLAIH